MKNRVVYSTNPDFQKENETDIEQNTLTPADQNLKVIRETKGRNGKTVTLITGFAGSKAELNKIGKQLKSQCGTGGAVKNGEIIIQGDFCDKVIQDLKARGYKVKRSGG